MHDTVFDSKIKQKILVVLTEQPGRFFSVRELSVRSGIGQARVKSLLSSFLKNRILNVAEKHRERFFQIDRRSALFQELNKIFGSGANSSRRDLLEKILASTGDVRLAALTGVFTGLTKAGVDLLLVGKVSAKRLERALKQLESLTGVEVNYALMDEGEYRQRQYSFDWFLKEIMENDPVVLIDKVSKGSTPAKRRVTALYSATKR